MSVQLLSSEYINKVNPQRVQQWVDEGKVKKQGNQYFVAGKDIGIFPESCYVKDGDSVKLYQINAKGTVVEKTVPQQKGTVVGTPVTSYSVNVSGIIERMGLTDETLQAEFKTFLSSQQGLTVDTDGNISFSDQSALNNALAAFAQKHQENFVDPNAQKFVTFTEDSDQEVIDNLAQGDNPAIASQPAATGTRRYAVQDETALTNALSTQIGDTTYEPLSSRTASVEAGVVTTTTTKEGVVNVPDKLKHNKSGRKQLQADAKEAYADLVANADPAMRDAIDLYIAERKYSGQIDKKMNELLEYKTTMGGTKEKSATRDGADIIQLYIDQYANESDRNTLNEVVTQIQNSGDANDQQAIMDALKVANIIGADTTFDKLPDSLKKKGALLCMAKQCGYEPNNLLRLMATYEVMNARSSEQILKDDKYFIEQQAKDFVKNKQAGQDVSNTTVYFSKKGRKNAPADGKEHTDIGDKGRALVKACPEMLGDAVTDNAVISRLSKLSDKQLEEEGFVKAQINGQVKYFQFSQEKWQTFMGICCDPSRTTDAEMNVLFGNDETRKKNFLKDLNLTLQEGRSVLEMSLPSPYGETGTLQFANIIGNNNGKIDNKELNALRHMAESAGYSVDGNSTYGKRLLHVLKNAGIGAGLGILTGGMGSLLAGAVNFAGQTASQLVTLNGPVTLTGPASLTGNVTLGYSDSVTTTDVTNTIVGGETFTDTTTHVTDVSGTTTGSATLTGDVILTGDASLTDRVDGQEYSDSGNNHLKTAANAGILGGIGGTVRGLVTMRGVHERGRNTDDVFDLTRLVEHEEVVNDNLSIQIPQFTTVQTRSGQMEVGTEIPKLKAVAYRGPSAYNGLYRYENGDPVSPRDFAKAYQNQIGGVMTDYNFFVYPELTVPGKGKIVPVDDYEAEYRKITPGTQGGKRGIVINSQGKRTAHATGTIRA